MKTSWIALAIFIVVIAGISYFVYGGRVEGIAFVVGQAGGVFFIPALIALFVSKRNHKPYRWDIVFAICAIVLVTSNVQKLLGAYDAFLVKHAVQSGGPTNAAQAILTSQTEIGDFTRTIVTIVETTNAKITAAYDELDDPIFVDLLSPPKVTNRKLVQSAHDTAILKRQLVKSATTKIDALMQGEADQIEAALALYSEDIRSNGLAGTKKRLATERAFYVRKVEISGRLLDALAAITAFLLTDGGSYSAAADNRSIVFPTKEIAAQYNSLVGRLTNAASEQDRLDADMVAYEKSAAERLYNLSKE